MSTRSITSFEGRELFDSSGYKVGDIETVLRGDPAFALVKSGQFGTIRRLVPLDDVRESGEEFVVPYSKDKVRLMPAVKRGAWTGVEGVAAGS